jgi:heptosyltransferase-2
MASNRNDPLPDFERILVRATNWVGDAVMSLPALQAIRARWPRAHISVLARPWVADLYESEPFADQVILLTAARGTRDLAGKWRAVRDLRARRFDCAILLQNAFEAALIAWLARIPRRIGYDRDGRGILLTDPVPLPKPVEIPRHERFYYLELLRRAGIIEGDLPDAPIHFDRARQLREAGPRALAGSGLPTPTIGVSPGAAFGSAKRWPASRFADAAAQLAAKLDCGVAVFGSKDERPLCAEVAQIVQERGRVARNFAGETTLRAFIELAAGCCLYLTNDSGAMHVAYALGIPTVAVFGSTDEFGTGPVGAACTVVREKVECSPCLLRECPIDHRCMERVTVERVVRAALDLTR